MLLPVPWPCVGLWKRTSRDATDSRDGHVCIIFLSICSRYSGDIHMLLLSRARALTGRSFCVPGGWPFCLVEYSCRLNCLSISLGILLAYRVCSYRLTLYCLSCRAEPVCDVILVTVSESSRRVTCIMNQCIVEMDRKSL